MSNREGPKPGVFIHGFFIEGAKRHGIHLKSGGGIISHGVIRNCGGCGIVVGEAPDLDEDPDDEKPRLT